MAGKREAIRKDLTERLLDAATQRIRSGGLGELRARDITNDAACGLGTIYKCFADLDDLILKVNSKTIQQLTREFEASQDNGLAPDARLRALADAYLTFAEANPKLWAALFEHRMPEGAPVPDWHLVEHNQMLAYVAAPLSELMPEQSDDALQLRVRSVFAAVHGVVLISFEGRHVGVRRDALREEIRAFVDILIRGIRSAGEETS